MQKSMIQIKLTIIATAAVLAGCSITPKALEPSEIAQINYSDRQLAFADMEPHGEVITIDEAIARALKYNLDHRVKTLEQSLAAGQLEAGKFDMLPKLLANAGYSWRDNNNLRYKADSSTPNTFDKNQRLDLSNEAEHNTADLALSWTLLDFGASYYTAKQNADKLLIASEHRRKAIHTLIQNVRTSYWRAVAAETLSNDVRLTIDDAETALQNAYTLAKERVRAPDESLRYQRNLLENLRLLESVERELASARIELTNLMGLLPGSTFKLIEPTVNEKPLDVDMPKLEALALMQNADLREQFYNARIAAEDTRKELLRLLPGITLDYGTYRDDDMYLVNEQWKSAGVRISFNLFNLLAAPSKMKAAEKNEAVTQARRMALQMSVLTQVHLAHHQYTDSLRQFQRADAIYNVDAQLKDIIQSKLKSQVVGDQTRISANVTSILSLLRRYQSMAKLQESIGRLQANLGMEPELNSLDETNLTELTKSVGQWLNSDMVTQLNNFSLPAISEPM
ncbi:TolC family protein [Neptunomonas phycophila]|uniref:TolC family protein n=1 Tax=Neptunomonas phycophila TaxID=1572645 RepID=UPI003517374B